MKNFSSLFPWQQRIETEVFSWEKKSLETFACFKSQQDKQNLIDEIISSNKIEKKEMIHVFLKKNKMVHVFYFLFLLFRLKDIK